MIDAGLKAQIDDIGKILSRSPKSEPMAHN
jgi:hypothetical protein